MKDLIIVGASGLGREVAWIVERINEKDEEWNIVGFLDDNPDLKGISVNGYQVLGGVSDGITFRRRIKSLIVGNLLTHNEIIYRLCYVK